MNKNPFEKFRSEQAKICHQKVKLTELLDDEEADALVHALVDISESIEKVYGCLIQQLIDADEKKIDSLKECLWDIREEFRHIDYHIRDGRLTEL